MNFYSFKGIIFDLDGTLVNSSHVWSKIDEEFMAKRGIELPPNYFKEVSAMNFMQASVYTNERFSLNENPEDIIAEWNEMARHEYAHNIRLKAGAEEFLKRLKQKGVKIALATASSEELYTAVLKSNGVYGLFDYFASTDRVSRGKGFPDVYELACGGLGLKPSECAVFEDIIEGIRGALLGGFTAVACLDKHYSADWEEMKRTADCYFFTYEELLK